MLPARLPCAAAPANFASEHSGKRAALIEVGCRALCLLAMAGPISLWL